MGRHGDMPGPPKTQRPVDGFGDSDSGPFVHIDLHTSGGSQDVQCRTRIAEIEGIVVAIDRQPLGKIARTTQKVMVTERCRPVPADRFDTGVDLRRAQQHGARDSIWLRHEIGAVMHAVREIYVEVSRVAEHHPVADGRATKSV